MKNRKVSEIKKMTSYALTERLHALSDILQKLKDYWHVFNDDEKLHAMVQAEISDICKELHSRQ